MNKHLVNTLVLSVLILCGASMTRAEEELVISTGEEDAVPTSTATQIPPKPTAVPTLVPTPKPTPVPSPAPAPVVKPVETVPIQSQPSVSEDRAELAQDEQQAKVGLLKHPILHLAGDVFYAQGLNGEPASGFGADLRVEGQFFTWLSLGGYYDFSLYSGGGKTVVAGPMGLLGRIIPFKTKNFTFYLIGGLGLNSLVRQNTPTWPANYHGFAGLGVAVPIQSKWSLDLSVVYNYFSPELAPVSSISPRIGVSYAIGL